MSKPAGEIGHQPADVVAGRFAFLFGLGIG